MKCDAVQAKNGNTCPPGQLFFFFNFESSAAENDVITKQPSCSHLNLPVIITLIMLAACRLVVDGFIPGRLLQAKMGLTFHSQSFPLELSSSQSRGCCQSLKMTPISPIWGPAHARGGILTRLRAHRHASVYERRRLHHAAAANWTEDVRMTMTAMLRRRFHARKWTGKETALREEANVGGSQVSRETSKRAISPAQMRLLCQVQGYYDAAEESPLKQGAKRRHTEGARQYPFLEPEDSDQTGKIFTFFFYSH